MSLFFGVVGGTVTDTTYDAEPPVWNVYSNYIEMAYENSGGGDYYFTIELQITSDSTADELTVYFQFENDGTAGQSATIDDVTLQEL